MGLKDYVLFAAALLIAFVSTDAKANDDQKNTGSKTVEFSERERPKWLLPPLTKEERFSKIKEFISPYSFELYFRNNYTQAEKKKCNSDLEHLRAIEAVNIIEPIYVSHKINDLQMETIFKKCENRFTPGIMFASENGWDDKSGSYIYQVQATKNIEYYDLSEYVNAGTWAVIGEAAIPINCSYEYKSFCENFVGYSATGQIFNFEEDCELVSHVSPRQRVEIAQKNDKGVISTVYYKTNNFFSFVSLKGNLYFLSFHTDLLPNKACMDMSDPCPLFLKRTKQTNAILNMTLITDSQAVTTNTCDFILTEPLLKGK